MKLAVFTSRYPARIATFFERDMRALLETGLEIDVFAISPLEASAWSHSLDLLGPEHLPRERVHHLTVGAALDRARPTLRRRFAPAARDAIAMLRSAARYGPVRLAKTAYLLPKAWGWAAESAQYDHVLAYWGNYAGTCAYAFHRLAAPSVPFSIWLHAGTDLYRAPVFMREKLRYADNIITCCEFNQGYIRREFADVKGLESKLHVCHHGLNLADFPHTVDGRAPNRLLAVGRLANRKGFDYLVRAAQVLKARGVDVVVEFVGDGELRPELQALAVELDVADRVVRESYGMTETVAGASQCSAGRLHQWPELGHVEIRSDGELVCTGLLNDDMPLVRYRVGDRGRPPADTTPCACGRALPAMGSIDGRTNDLLLTADGRQVFWLNPVFYGLSVRQSQIVQEELDLLLVRIAPAPGFTAGHEQTIINRLRERMGDVRVTVERVDEVPRSANGKLRAVISNLSASQRAEALERGV